ncbi:MAG: extracellular solute-binding protein [Clostridia bacterium]|nr:extracellular solute-binding protein [Clostridia bacterium]
MKTYARIIAMLCALMMLTGCFVGCADTQDPAETTEAAQTQAPSESADETVDLNLDKDGFWKDDLPEELDFNEIVTILYWLDAERKEFVIEEDEADGDMVKEAIYNRNMATEERLGITFEWVGQNGDSGDRANFTNYVQNCYSGGTYYDIIATYSRTAGMLLTEGLLQDLNSIDDNYINTTQPWWPKTMLETCSIADSLFFVSGDISTNVLHFMYAVYYNMDMLKNFQIEDPIQFVDDKTWTIDKLIELSTGLYSDLDQDGAQSDNDQYGFSSTYFHLDAFYTGSNMKLIEAGNDDYLQITEDFFGEKTVNLVDKLGTWFKSGDTYVNHNGGSKGYTVTFEEGNCAFRLDRVYIADNEYHNGALRNADWEYGILPVPLHDENQEDYITVVGNPFTLWCVMQNAKDPSMSTAVIECLASEGYRKTSPALFENNMKYRYTPDNAGKGDGARMFDIVRSSITFDLGRIFSDILGFMSEMPSNTAATSGSWSGVQAKYKTTLKRGIADLNKALEQVID